MLVMIPSNARITTCKELEYLGETTMKSVIEEPLSKKTMHPKLRAALWVTQLLLAVLFSMAGVMKMSQPITQLLQMLPWTAKVPELLVRFIGISEFAGALGLVLPAATRIMPMLTPTAAIGLALVMLLAACFHISQCEFASLPLNIILAALAGFVAWGRLTEARISRR